jgi:TfoX/Sxy family transcriptional regulator of competence genes
MAMPVRRRAACSAPRLAWEGWQSEGEGGTGALSYDPEAAERVRRLLSGRDDVVEKKMVGGLSFLVNGNMCCGVTGTALMVRVGADGREQAVREPHVRPMQFAGRALSGFICVEPAGFAADDALARWVQRGVDFVSGLPVKPVRTGK